MNVPIPVCSGDLAHRTKTNGDARIQRILRVIAANPSHDIAALARMVNLSCSRLSHLFKLETGFSLRGFLVDCRLETAALVLRRSEASVKEVSYNVGYQHPPSFVRAFHGKFGCSPGEYRAQQQILRMCS